MRFATGEKMEKGKMKRAATRQDAVVGIARDLRSWRHHVSEVLDGCMQLAMLPKMPRHVIAGRLRRLADEGRNLVKPSTSSAMTVLMIERLADRLLGRKR
jgi:hypothetical protein